MANEKAAIITVKLADYDEMMAIIRMARAAVRLQRARALGMLDDDEWMAFDLIMRAESANFRDAEDEDG